MRARRHLWPLFFSALLLSSCASVASAPPLTPPTGPPAPAPSAPSATAASATGPSSSSATTPAPSAPSGAATTASSDRPATAAPGPGAPSSGAAPAPSQPAEGEPNVRPGANREYLSPDLDVDAWVKRFETDNRDIFLHRQEILRATGVGPGQAVADVGAGTGLFTLLFARAVGPRGRVYAVDIAPKFLAHIDRRARQEGLRNVVTRLGTDRSTALPPASVDLVFLCDVYHHFEYPRSILASLHQALRPGGTLFLVDFKRVPGESPGWVLDHVRAGEEIFTQEIQAAGFHRASKASFLKDNYAISFTKN